MAGWASAVGGEGVRMRNKNKRILYFFLPILLTACAFSKYPGGGVSAMSAETLCWRSAYAAYDPAIEDEIAVRELDCVRILAP